MDAPDGTTALATRSAVRSGAARLSSPCGPGGAGRPRGALIARQPGGAYRARGARRSGLTR